MIHVDDTLCDLHGQCVFAAPTVFSFDDAGALAYVVEPGAEFAPQVRAAIAICPTSAISLQE
jgi:ferredoxin